MLSQRMKNGLLNLLHSSIFPAIKTQEQSIQSKIRSKHGIRIHQYLHVLVGFAVSCLSCHTLPQQCIPRSQSLFFINLFRVNFNSSPNKITSFNLPLKSVKPQFTPIFVQKMRVNGGLLEEFFCLLNSKRG